MSSSKRLFVAAGFVAVALFSLGVPSATADWMVPTAVWDHSPQGAETASGNMIDNDQNTFYKLIHDGVSTDPAVTNYVVLDLGAKYDVSGFKFWPRIHASANTGPEDLDIFYCANEALMPSEGWVPNATASLAADSNVVIAASTTLPAIHGAGESDTTSFTPFQARYVGLWCRSSYDGTPAEGGVACYAEVQFNASTIPEPNTLLLLAIGITGLLAYAWRTRK